ncbi:MAG TPA: TlpA disulfide reductase family protein [Gemmatimonadales bacterium]|jgi:thiol-disulfide isomerase/thioredoxin|nr:TlpA disulfide reductase family protein [Gemmatimonadales bacterium]
MRKGFTPVLLAAGLLAARPAGAQTGIAVGDKAPVVTVQDLDGNRVDLGRWIGKKPVFLEFWATWCTNCAELLPTVKAAAARYGAKVEFLGMNVTTNQTLARVRRYRDTEKPPYRPLWDEGKTSLKAYQVPGTSYVVIIDAKGKVIYTGFGGKQDFADALKRVAG